MAALSPLRRRMIEDMTIRNLSPAMQRSYIHAVARFSDYFGRSPDKLALDDVRAYQVHRLERRRLGFAQLGSLRLADFLRSDARPGDHSGTHPLRPRAAQAADGLERRGGRALPGGGFESEGARRVDDGLPNGREVSEAA